jgi:nicotinate dehydrogenase subunit B
MTAVQEARGFSSGSLSKNPKVGQWISLAVPNIILIRTGKVEFGQGIGTALSQIAAEELNVDINSVRIEAVSTAHSPDEGVTSGSMSIQHSGTAVRQACGTLRAMAKRAYAQSYAVAEQDVVISAGLLAAGETQPAASYWNLGLDILLDSTDVAIEGRTKAAADYDVVGMATQRKDLEAKVFGRASFIQDVVMPNMLHGRVVRQPSRWAKLLDVDEIAFAAQYPDVHLIRDGSFLGVLAKREEMAINAAAYLLAKSRWSLPEALPQSDGLNAWLKTAPSQAHVVATHHEGTAAKVITSLKASYSRPFVVHASIGPSCGLAHWQPGRLDVWSHSQGIFNLKSDIDVFLARDHAHEQIEVVVHHVEGAGCYGHNPADDVAFDAVLLSRFAQGRPVRVLWTRADELSCGPSGPAHLVELEGGLDVEGKVVDWHHTIWANGYTARPGRAAPGMLSFLSAAEIARPFDAPVSLDPPMSAGGGSDRNSIPGYEFAHHEIVTNRLLEMPVRTSSIRALGGYTNVWAIEQFMDELAHASGQDPVAFRMAHLIDPRGRAVIRKAIDSAPWWHDNSSDPEGAGRGIAYARYKHTGAWCAVAVRIVAEEAVRVLDISISADLGLVINPDGAANQLEGGAIQSCSWTLKEALQFDRQRITTRSWADYPILLFSEAPTVTVTLIDQPDQPSLGAGEASQGPTAAAIGNAVFDALGVRVRDLPITPDRIVSAMASS